MFLTYMVHFCLAEEFEKVPSRHELHDDVHWVVVHTHTKNLDNVWVIEVTVEGEGGKNDGVGSILSCHCNNTYAISAASERNFRCSSTIDPLRNVC